MNTGKPNLYKILQTNDILGETESFRILFPLAVNIISGSQSQMLIRQEAFVEVHILYLCTVKRNGKYTYLLRKKNIFSTNIRKDKHSLLPH